MSNKLMRAVLVCVTLMLASAALADSVVVGDFEGNLDGWRAGDDFTLSFSATGATAGAQALQVDGPGGWHIDGLLDAKPHLAALGNKGVKVTADVTAFDADMTTGWMQVEMVINAQNNDEAGTHNNIGWNELGFQDVIRDGQPHTYTWVLSDALTAKIALADDGIYWFELALVSNLDSASVTKFYIDNIQVSYEPPTSSIVIGDFEGGSLDNWGPAWEGSPVLANATVGVTSGSGSLSVTTNGGYYCLQWNAPSVPESLAGQKLQFDLTMIASEWPVGLWTKVADKVALNSNGTSGWKEYATATAIDTLTSQATSLDWGRWWDAAPDVVKTYTVDISDYDLTGATWFQINITIQGGDGLGHFYFDNVQLVGPALSTGKSTDTVIGNFEQDLDGWVVGGSADVRYSDTNGVTLDQYSLDVYTPTGAWASVLTLNILDPNLTAVRDAFFTNTKLSADITRLVVDWPVDDIPGWNGIHLIINCGGDGWSLWQNLGYQAHWLQTQGDLTQTATWDYSPYLSTIQPNNLTWCSLELVVNANDENYAGWVWFYVDNVRLSGGGIALNPQPANDAKDVDIQTTLGWTAGGFAQSHNVYLGTSRAAVAAADTNSDPDVIFATVDGASFDPGALEFDTLYFWRVDAVNDVNPDSPWVGPVWSFTTANFLVVDGFETYNADIDGGGTIFQTWSDGFDDPDNNGSQVGYITEPFTEPTVVHTGGNSMPFGYSNTKAAISTAVRTWSDPQDWTINGFNAMKLYLQGKADNVADRLFITVADAAGASATVVSDNTDAMTTEAWTEWVIPLTDFAGVDMTAVTEMTIGVGGEGGPSGAAGLLFVDDILIGFTPIGLVASYSFEGNVEDGSGNGHDGVLAGDPNYPATFVSGPAGLGQAMLFDGANGHQHVTIGTFNPSAATGQLSLALWAKWDGPSGSWQGMIGKRNSGDWDATIMMWYFELERDVWDVRFVRPGSGLNTGQTLQVGQWTHLAVTFDGTTGKVYINGEVVLEGDFSFGQDKAAPIQIGASVDGGGNPFNGAMDEVRIYDGALSADEVRALAGK